MKKRGMTVLQVLISAVALAFLLARIGLRETLAALSQADPRYLVAAFLLFVFSLVIRACRWLVLIRGLGLDVSFGRLLYLYFVGQFFSAFLPSSFGGDVVRALELTQNTDPSAAFGTVLLDRMTGLMILSAMGLGVLPFQSAHMERWLVWLMVGVAGGILIAGGLILEGGFLRRITAWLPAGLSLAGGGALARFYAALTGCGWQAVTKAFAVSVAFNIVNVVINWLCGVALGTGISLGYFFAVTPLLSVSGLIPSIGGWGVRETVATAVFSSTAAGANAAAAIGLSLGLVMLAAGLVGGILYGLEGILSLRARRQ